MIHRFSNWNWSGINAQTYKDDPGTWVAVTRRAFTDDASTSFEVRYFEIEPNGYTSFERHRHEHLVVVLRGRGRVRLGADWHDLSPHDVVRVPADLPHRFQSETAEPFGILCIVDRDRDRPNILDPTEEV
jgi:quercetin dioxygenase-like cupin family protein